MANVPSNVKDPNVLEQVISRLEAIPLESGRTVTLRMNGDMRDLICQSLRACMVLSRIAAAEAADEIMKRSDNEEMCCRSDATKEE